jgi:hypothetical protein
MTKPEIKIVNYKRNPNLNYPTIYCGRPKWLGNPFVMRKERDRTLVIEKYKQYFDQQMISNQTFKDQFFQMCKDYEHYPIIQLACYCAPKACHASIIKQAMEEYYAKSSS